MFFKICISFLSLSFLLKQVLLSLEIFSALSLFAINILTNHTHTYSAESREMTGFVLHLLQLKKATAAGDALACASTR